MSLKLRFLCFSIVLFLSGALVLGTYVRQLATQIVEDWALRYVEKQVLYDKFRTLQPIMRDVALSQQLSESKQIKAWAKNPDNPQLKAQALAEVESFRQNLTDKNYFVVLANNGHYYYNNAQNEHANQLHRYTLQPGNLEDQWFYETVKQNRDIDLNVNSDENLGVTQIWINVLIREGDHVLGMLGSGLALTPFISKVMNHPDPGIISLFTDPDGAVQLHRDQGFIDFASVTKPAAEKQTIDKLFVDAEDSAALHELMAQLNQAPDRVLSRFVHMEGRRYLAGMTYIPEIDWYEITLLDLDEVLPLSIFSGMLVAFSVTLLIIPLLLYLAFRRYVLRPLNALDGTIISLREGDFNNPVRLNKYRNDEIGQLMDHFQALTETVIEGRQTLENRVQERTDALERLSNSDTLTGLLNRRGMECRLAAAYEHISRQQRCFGLLWLDIDLFKQVNDQYGHDAGDLTLKAVAGEIQKQLRGYDCAARWGGDEFLLLIETHEAEPLDQIGQRICEKVAALRLHALDDALMKITVSIGGYLAGFDDSLETILSRADQALYAAKDAGRNHYYRHRSYVQNPDPASTRAKASKPLTSATE